MPSSDKYRETFATASQGHSQVLCSNSARAVLVKHEEHLLESQFFRGQLLFFLSHFYYASRPVPSLLAYKLGMLLAYCARAFFGGFRKRVIIQELSFGQLGTVVERQRG